jgi:hemolysin activation/secretion protein
VAITGLIVTGATVFTEREIDAATASLRRAIEEGPVGPERILEVLAAINQLYADAGYIGSGAKLPEQDLADGQLQIDVVESRLKYIDIQSNGRLSGRYVRSIVGHEVSSPIRMDGLRRAFSRLEDDPNVEQVQGRVLPGKAAGEASLALAIVERDPFDITVRLNNYRSPSVGSVKAQVLLDHRNLSGHSDSIHLEVAESEGTSSAAIQYAFPLMPWGTRVRVFYGQGEFRVVEEPFGSIGIESDIDTLGARVEQTLVLGSDQRLTFSAGVERKQA